MPAVPAAEKEKGKKKKMTAEGDKANSTEPETQEEETQSTDVTMADTVTSQTLVEDTQVEEETQLEETGDQPDEEVRTGRVSFGLTDGGFQGGDIEWPPSPQQIAVDDRAPSVEVQV